MHFATGEPTTRLARPPSLDPKGIDMTPRTSFHRQVLALSLLVIATACGGQVTEQGPANAPTSTVAATTGTTGLSSPIPDYSWELNGTGTATTGDLDVEFLGAFDATPGAVSFDGYTGHAVTTGPFALDTAASFTIAAWVNYAARSEIAAAVSQLAEVTGVFQLGVGEASQWWFMMKTEDRTGLDYAVWVDGPPAKPGGQWTHLVGVSDQGDGMLRLFLDGELAGEVPFDAPLGANGPLTIGRAQFDATPGNFWPGAIDLVQVFQRALDEDQVAELNAVNRPQDPPPAMPAPDPSTYAEGILTGTWDYVIPAEDAPILRDALGVPDAKELGIRIGFDGHTWWQGFVIDGELMLEPGGVPAGDGGTFLIDGSVMVQANAWGHGVLEWRLEDDQLSLAILEICNDETGVCLTDRNQILEADPFVFAVVEHTYVKSGDDGGY